MTTKWKLPGQHPDGFGLPRGANHSCGASPTENIQLCSTALNTAGSNRSPARREVPVIVVGRPQLYSPLLDEVHLILLPSSFPSVLPLYRSSTETIANKKNIQKSSKIEHRKFLRSCITTSSSSGGRRSLQLQVQIWLHEKS